ncbi:MAG: DUF255 domain-containing protein, partial [Elusimicrobia bacterium]|nr:DUF255 domain-containing protein [Elusimicrobiota bacterium]
MEAAAEPKPKKKGHAASVLLCGAIFIAAGVAAAYLAFARRVPVPSIGSSGARGGVVPTLSGFPPAPRAKIAWRSWGAAAFREANTSDRLVLLDLTSSWSHWSKLMELGTYGDPAAAAWISSNLVPVRLDRDARPDLARRYGSSVPTTALLLPTGEALAEGSVIDAATFSAWAGRVLAAYRSNREALADARAAARARAAGKAKELLGPARDAEWKAKSIEEKRGA